MTRERGTLQFMDSDCIIYLLIGFGAQIVDGALGMAYGLTASSCLLAAGLPPVTASATVHLAETVTTGASALSHKHFGNIDKALFRRLIIPAVLGAMVGAYALTTLPGDVLKPYIAGYILMMGGLVLVKAFKTVPPVPVSSHLAPLGFFGALIDAIGGGGWGPIVASTLLARGNHSRTTVGTVNSVEFFVTMASSLVFILTIGFSHWNVVLPLGLGGLIAAPFAAWMCSRIPHRPMMFIVGLLIMIVSFRTLWLSIAG